MSICLTRTPLDPGSKINKRENSSFNFLNMDNKLLLGRDQAKGHGQRRGGVGLSRDRLGIKIASGRWGQQRGSVPGSRRHRWQGARIERIGHQRDRELVYAERSRSLWCSCRRPPRQTSRYCRLSPLSLEPGFAAAVTCTNPAVEAALR
jgi:hypothetical protein